MPLFKFLGKPLQFFSYLILLLSLFPITVLLSHYRNHVLFLASDLLLQVFLYAVLNSEQIDPGAFHGTHCCKVVLMFQAYARVPLYHHCTHRITAYTAPHWFPLLPITGLCGALSMLYAVSLPILLPEYFGCLALCCRAAFGEPC